MVISIYLYLLLFVRISATNQEKCYSRKIPILMTSEGKIAKASFPSAAVGMTVESIETCTLRVTGKIVPMATIYCSRFKSGWVTYNTIKINTSACSSFENAELSDIVSSIPSFSITKTGMISGVLRTQTQNDISKTIATEITRPTVTYDMEITKRNVRSQTPPQIGRLITMNQSLTNPAKEIMNGTGMMTWLEKRIQISRDQLDAYSNFSQHEFEAIVNYINETVQLVNDSKKIPEHVATHAIEVIDKLTKITEELQLSELTSDNLSKITTAKTSIRQAMETFSENWQYDSNDDDFTLIDTSHFLIYNKRDVVTHVGAKVHTVKDINGSVTYDRQGATFKAHTAIDNFAFSRSKNENGSIFHQNTTLDLFNTNKNITEIGFHEHNERLVITTFNVPWSVLEKANANNSNHVTVSFILHKNSFLFPSKIYRSNQVISVRVNGLTDLQNLPEPVTFTMEMYDQQDKHAAGINHVCGYWNESNNCWSMKGCSVLYGSEYPGCQCNHLTNFAVLMDIHHHSPLPTNRHGFLSVVSQIGCGMSIAGLVLILIIHASFKQLHSKRPQMILLHLTCVLLLSYLVFVFGIDRTDSYLICVCVTATLHYLWLSVWCWMAVEGHTMNMLLVKVMTPRANKYMTKACIFAYGIPLMIVGASVGISIYFENAQQSPTEYYNRTGGESTGKDHWTSAYTGEKFCWPRGYSLYFGFILPVGILMVFNLINFVLVIYILTCGKTKIQSSASKRSMSHTASMVLSVLSLLGITWIFGFMGMVNEHSTYRFALNLIFSVLNSFQGFLIFLLFCVRHKQVRKLWIGAIKTRLPCFSTKSKTVTGSNRGSMKEMPLTLTTNRKFFRSNSNILAKTKGTRNAELRVAQDNFPETFRRVTTYRVQLTKLVTKQELNVPDTGYAGNVGKIHTASRVRIQKSDIVLKENSFIHIC